MMDIKRISTFVLIGALAAGVACAEPGGSGRTPSEDGTPRSQDPAALPPDDGAVGSMGSHLLSADIADVVVEIDTTEGRSMTEEARSTFESRLSEHGSKSVTYDGGSTVPGQDTYSDDDLRSIAASNRTTASSEERIGIYVLILDGRYEREDVVGVAFDATSFAIFPERIEGGLLGLSYDRYETAVVVHELGHLFGLVDLTGEGAFHEDPDHPGHSANEESVMYWRVEDASITSFFEDGPPTEFDQDDRTEMDRIRA